MKLIFLKIIKFYQIILSPENGILKLITGGKVCRFYPSCSEYGYESIKKHGVFRGLILMVKRLSKCHPFNSGGVDLP